MCHIITNSSQEKSRPKRGDVSADNNYDVESESETQEEFYEMPETTDDYNDDEKDMER